MFSVNGTKVFLIYLFPELGYEFKTKSIKALAQELGLPKMGQNGFWKSRFDE